ncbi:extracellular solute-binding protein [Arsenicitalea aurantiaca]|uniref:Extracellular solute-binding protein n=1 Tax=Arsenicitalea aurantiaca TaxID=1783274 RepID=A0A433X4A2_9HYPH|nr:extracellular solute-binding protein [Arsenicitalea aurantiaca]RUT28894.1 extracellular solute-binding protein [Arsenicitalea aurantiaca]
MTITLKGMTWRHPRGFDPMVATAAIWQDRTGVAIAWEQRSLQDFESFPVETLAREYDLIVIDHPHVGQITAENCLVPLDVPGREAERAALLAGSVGGSYESYGYDGRQWAFPIDAAAQVQAYRPDIIAPVTRWSEVVEHARAGRVVLPLLAPHSLMCFFTLAANMGHPCASGRGTFVHRETGLEIIAMLEEMAALSHPMSETADPIGASEAMAETDSGLALMPLGYGYASYALSGFRPHRLGFADIPAAGQLGPVGSALGGTGIAVSAFGAHRDAAIDYAYWVASGSVQAGPYAGAGGQPGHAEGWEDDAVNAASGDFYRASRRTLDGAYMRPRHNGYMEFQDRAARRLTEGLYARHAGSAILDDLERLYQESF